eukprot:g2099.t1
MKPERDLAEDAVDDHEEFDDEEEDIYDDSLNAIFEKADQDLRVAVGDITGTPSTKLPVMEYSNDFNDLQKFCISYEYIVSHSLLSSYFKEKGVDPVKLKKYKASKMERKLNEKLGENWLEELFKDDNGETWRKFLKMLLLSAPESHTLLRIFLEGEGHEGLLPKEFKATKQVVVDHIEKLNTELGTEWIDKFKMSKEMETLHQSRGVEKGMRLSRLSDFKILRAIGKGAFGTVSPCVCRFTGKLLACKSIDKRILQIRARKLDKGLQLVKSERNLLAMLGFRPVPTCLSLHFSFEDDDSYHLLTQFCNGGDLDYRICNTRTKNLCGAKIIDGRCALPREEVLVYAAEMAAALNYLHKMKVAHRDMKPMNVLLTGEGHTVLSDFGLSAKILKPRKGRVGTPGYIPPEMLLGEEHDLSCDWFSYGATIYALIRGRSPFHLAGRSMDLKTFSKSYASGKSQLDYDSSLFDDDMKEFIKKCMEREPEDRADFEWIKNHSIFAGIDWDKALNHELEPKFKPGVTVNAKSVLNLHQMAEDDEKIRKKTKLDPGNTIAGFHFVSRSHHRNGMNGVFLFMEKEKDAYNALPVLETPTTKKKATKKTEKSSNASTSTKAKSTTSSQAAASNSDKEGSIEVKEQAGGCCILQ